jgi:uncharacterized membrane protein YagU involved in acid resistance
MAGGEGIVIGTLLFSERSLWTMFHVIALGGGAMMGLSAALFSIHAMRGESPRCGSSRDRSRDLVWLTALTAGLLWATVLVGTYASFPPYRATPPAGITDLAAYPKARIQSRPDTVWLHSFAMETKEHLPWIAAILTTAAAFLCTRYRSRVLSDARLNALAKTLLAVSLAIVALVSLLGIFVNKVAPLE